MCIRDSTKGAGRVTDETLAWAKKQLEKAREEGIEVITATHQSVLPQNKRMVFGFITVSYTHLDVYKRQCRSCG